MHRHAPTASNSAPNYSGGGDGSGALGHLETRTPWLIAVPRFVLGAIFASAALSYFWSLVFGWALLPVPTTPQAMQFAGAIIKIGYLWPLMKAINLAAGVLLIVNRAPALAVALLLPVTVIIVWFQIFLNPLPMPVATAVLAAICELVLLRAYAGRYADMFVNDTCSARESTQ